MSTQIDVLDDTAVPFYPAASRQVATERDILMRLLAVIAGQAGIGGSAVVSISDGAAVTIGAKADAAVVNPASSASVVALLKGILTEDVAALAALALMAPASNAAVVTPSDSVDLASPSRAIFVTADGNLKVNMVGAGAGITFTGLTAGMTLPIRVARVLSTGTTATVAALW